MALLGRKTAMMQSRFRWRCFKSSFRNQFQAKHGNSAADALQSFV